jgi:hypothetical protein
MASELLERGLYNGKHFVVHNPNARGRAPRYLVNGTEKPKGVTTILGSTLSKDLTQWAVDSAIGYLRTKLPVVTEQDLSTAGREYMRLRDGGASTGTEAHAMVEGFLKKRKPSGQFSDEAIRAYNAFVMWFGEVEPEVINVEEVIYSEAFKFAGTYDCMLKINGKVVLCDLKTTNPSRKAPSGVYAENFVQLGAYALAHEEQRVYEEANGGTKLQKIDDLMVISAKKNGVLDIVSASELALSVDECGDMFKRVVNIHNFMASTTAKLGGK